MIKGWMLACQFNWTTLSIGNQNPKLYYHMVKQTLDIWYEKPLNFEQPKTLLGYGLVGHLKPHETKTLGHNQK
jgi:hypothetical protein